MLYKSFVKGVLTVTSEGGRQNMAMIAAVTKGVLHKIWYIVRDMSHGV
jgi:hypothetical protein